MNAAAPCEVWFYHLERTSLEQVLPELLEKTLARGWRAVVWSNDAARVRAIDDWLWTYREDSFLPHGIANEARSDRQPVIVGSMGENPNRANAAFVVDGEPDALTGFERCVVIFDGRDEPSLTTARGLWARLKGAGHAVTYWRQGEQRGWDRQA